MQAVMALSRVLARAAAATSRAYVTSAYATRVRPVNKVCGSMEEAVAPIKDGSKMYESAAGVASRVL